MTNQSYKVLKKLSIKVENDKEVNILLLEEINGKRYAVAIQPWNFTTKGDYDWDDQSYEQNRVFNVLEEAEKQFIQVFLRENKLISRFYV